MDRLFRTLSALLLLCCTWTQTSAQDTVRASAVPEYVGEHLRLLEDPSALLTVDDVAASDGFTPLTQKVPNLGISSDVHWLELFVLNDTGEDAVILDLEHAEVEHVTVYLAAAGKLHHIATTGQAYALSTRLVAQPEYVFPLPIAKERVARVLLRVKSDKQLQVPIKLHAPSRFSESRTTRNMLIGSYIGIMLVMGLYNLFIFFSIRDRSYLIYVSYILFVMLTQLAFWGIGQYYIWGGMIWFSVKASIVFTFLTAVAASEFMKHFIDTRSHVPRLHAGIKYFYGLFLVVVGTYMFFAPNLGYKLAQVSAGLFASYMLITIIKVRRMGSRQAGYFLVAWSVFLIGTMVFTLKDMGILPYNDITVFTMPVGSAIEGVLLSFGLADRINVLRREKERSQAEALTALQENERLVREQNVLLEEKVKQRTAALQESNEHLKRTQAQLVSAEKMASLGQLTAGIAHEINNPINFITSNIAPLRRNIGEIVEVMQEYRGMDPAQAAVQLADLRAREERLGISESIAELDDIINSIAEGSTRTAEIVRGLRNFSRLDESDLKDADLNEGLRSTLAVLQPQFKDKVDIRLELGTLPKVECFPGKVNQVFMNILTNGAQATLARMDGRPREVVATTRNLGDLVEIVITDTGVGMPPEVQARIFDPFFTTKAVGEGTGLGLSIVYGIIEDHHGSIAVESTPGVGTSFRIQLPIHQQRRQELRA